MKKKQNNQILDLFIVGSGTVLALIIASSYGVI